MPTYDFRCPQGHEFERFFRKISDALSELPCPECGQSAQRQLSAGAGLLFKGSGFYLTDYGKNAHRKPAGGGSAEKKPGESGSKDSSAAGEGGAKGSAPEAKSESAKPKDTGTNKAGGSGEG